MSVPLAMKLEEQMFPSDANIKVHIVKFYMLMYKHTNFHTFKTHVSFQVGRPTKMILTSVLCGIIIVVSEAYGKY